MVIYIFKRITKVIYFTKKQKNSSFLCSLQTLSDTPLFKIVYTGCFLKTCFFQELTNLIKITWRVKMSILDTSIWYDIWEFLCLLFLQERFKLASIFLNTAFGAKQDIAYSLVSSEMTTLRTIPIFNCMVLFWTSNNEPVSKNSKWILVWYFIRYKVHPSFFLEDHSYVRNFPVK